MRDSNHLLSFFRAFAAEWLTLMSGSAGVPLTILSVYVQNPAAKISLILTAIACFLWASYRIWRTERIKVLSLEQRIKTEANGINTDSNPITINFVNNDRHNLVKLLPAGTVQRLIRLSVKNNGNGWLSNCELRIDDASPRVVDVPYLLEKGFSLQKGESRYCLFLYFDEKYPDGRSGEKALLPFHGGGAFYRAQGFSPGQKVTFSLLASSDDPVTNTRAAFVAFIKEGQLCVEKL